MHLATRSVHFMANKSTCFRLFICVNVDRVAALDAALKEGREERGHALITYRLFARGTAAIRSISSRAFSHDVLADGT